MNKKTQNPIIDLETRFGGLPSEFRGELTLTIRADQVVDASHFLKDEAGFEMLLDITAVDYCPRVEGRFHLVYHFYSTKLNQILILRIPLDGIEPEIQTIEGVYPNANWYEREIWDLMGIRFSGHSDLRRILLPLDWEGHPLRKDYPLGYEEVQYTFNIDDVNKKKSYPKD
jgi:NADH-quinone oxidoreductase subunit C